MTRKFKLILLAVSLAVAVATDGYGQASRAVMVHSNSGLILYPTNFWSVNSVFARSGLSLAAHATSAVVPLTSGGTGATNAAGARTNLGLIWLGLTNSDSASFRTALGLQASWLTNTTAVDTRVALGLLLPALTNANNTSFRSAILPSYAGNSGKILAINSGGTDVQWVNMPSGGGGSVTNIGSLSVPIAISNGGTGATNAAGARFNLGFSANLETLWTSANLSSFRATLLPSYSNNASKVLRLNSLGTDVEWAEIAGGTNTNLLTLPLAVTNGGTGATNVTNARANLGFQDLGDWPIARQVTALNVTLINDLGQPSAFYRRGRIFFADSNGLIQNVDEITFFNGASAAKTRSNLGLSDSLTAYSSNAGKVLRVNIAEDDLELVGVPCESGSGTSSAIIGPISDGSVTATGSLSFVIGGVNNHASGVQSGIVGGGGNNVSGDNSVVVGGTSSAATANASFAGGGYARATNVGAFVWSDFSTTNTFSSTNSNSFNLRATGGMSLDLGTNGIVFRNNSGVTNTRKSILPPYITYTTNIVVISQPTEPPNASFVTNTNVTTNMMSGKVLAVNSNATDVEWVTPDLTNTGSGDLTFIFRTNSNSMTGTSIVYDSVLTHTFTSSGKYFVSMGHLMGVNTSSGLKAQMRASNAVIYGTWSFSSTALTNEYAYGLGTNSGNRMFHQWFIVDAEPNSSVTFGYAQTNFNATPTTILPGSFMRIEKMP